MINLMRSGASKSNIAQSRDFLRYTINQNAKTRTKLRGNNSINITPIQNEYRKGNIRGKLNNANLNAAASHHFAQIHNSVPNNLTNEEDIRRYLIESVHIARLPYKEKSLILNKIKDYYPPPANNTGMFSPR
jgi:hypothetical protein